MKLEAREKNIIFFDVMLLCALLFIGMSVSYVKVLVSVVLGWSYQYRKKAEIVYSLLFFYSFYCIFKITPSGTSLFNVVIAFAVVGLFVQRKRKSWVVSFTKKGMHSVVFLAVFCFYLFLTSIIRGRNDILTIFLNLFVPMLLVVGVSINKEDIEVDKLVYAYAAGIILSQAVGVGLIPIRHLNEFVSVVHYKAVGIRLTRFQGLTVNPNYFSLDVNLALAGLLVLPAKRKERKRPVAEILLLALLSATGILTLSKSFAVCFAATIFLYILIGAEKNKIGKITAFTVFLLVTLFFYRMYSGSSYIMAIIDRTNRVSSLKEFTSDRTVVWMNYLKYILRTPDLLILGGGAGAGRLFDYGASHSFYIECLYYFGIVGTVLFLIFQYSILEPNHTKAVFLLPAIAFMIRGVAINIVLREAFATDLIFILVFLSNSSVSANGILLAPPESTKKWENTKSLTQT